MLHYSSPKLRDEALPEMNQIANLFNNLFIKLNAAQNVSGMTLQRERDTAILEKDAVLAELEASKRQVAAVKAEMEALRQGAPRSTVGGGMDGSNDGSGSDEE